jgi:hypothetical protein
VTRARGGGVCPTCGQERPEVTAPLTPRELDVLAAWWIAGSVRKAANRAGVGEQRAKNMLARARIRSRVSTNRELLAAHMDAVVELVQSRVSQNISREEAA